jgi:hypothetical protein
MADSLQSRRDLLAWALRATTLAGTLPALALPTAAPESSARPTCLTQEFPSRESGFFVLTPMAAEKPTTGNNPTFPLPGGRLLLFRTPGK